MITQSEHRKIISKLKQVRKLHAGADGKLVVDIPNARDFMPRQPMNHPAQVVIHQPLKEPVPTITPRAQDSRQTSESQTDVLQHQPKIVPNPNFISTEMMPIYNVLKEILEELKRMNK